jgi:hypothetical protein
MVDPDRRFSDRYDLARYKRLLIAHVSIGRSGTVFWRRIRLSRGDWITAAAIRVEFEKR